MAKQNQYCHGMHYLPLHCLVTLFSGNTWRYIVFISFCFTLITSCTTVRKKDGPPPFYVDESRIPNAKPKFESKSKYGNMRSYVALGKRYYTLKSSKNFEETGVASWYGTLFNQRRTSSGERYNMLGMTAAHRSLPLPTYVEVTNLKNKRKVIVKVNDRGPFASNRIIDLSYVAAKKLGMIGHGTTHVHLKAINPQTYTTTPILLAKKAPVRPETYFPTQYETKTYLYLQVEAQNNAQRATELQRKIVKLLASRVSISAPEHTHTGYQIKLGPIHNMDTALKLKQKLRQLGIKPSVVKA